MAYEEWILKPKWFSAESPANPKKASKVLSITGVVSDTQTVTIGTNVYEFDINDTFTESRIQVDVADLRNEATGTLTFEDLPIATETVTLGSGDDAEVYEFVAAAEDADPANIPVVLGTTFTADNAVTKLAEAINENSALVTATFDTDDDDVVRISAIVKGTAGNSIAVAETCTNATFGAEVTTLAGGLDTITNTNAVTALTSAINANETLVTATDNKDGTMTLEYNTVGTAGNDVVIGETLVNGAWASAATKLSGGQYGTPCQEDNTLVYVSPHYYKCVTPGNRDDVAWEKFTPETY